MIKVEPNLAGTVIIELQEEILNLSVLVTDFIVKCDNLETDVYTLTYKVACLEGED